MSRLLFTTIVIVLCGDAAGVDTRRLMGSPEPLPAIELEVAFPNLKIDRPVQITHAGDGTDRLFVPTQGGAIHVFPNQRVVGQSEMFLDLQSTIGRVGGDNGLMSIAFPPDFRDRQQFYVLHVAPKRPKFTVVSRYRVSADNPNRADPESEETILRIPQPFNDHNAGCLKFGPDGYLFVALGDGGWNRTNRHAQDLSSLLGGILRIDVNQGQPYAIPPDNPFVGQAQCPPGDLGLWLAGAVADLIRSFDRAPFGPATTGRSKPRRSI